VRPGRSQVHVRAHRLSRRAGPQPGQRGYVAAGIETMLRTARTLASGQDLPTVVGKASANSPLSARRRCRFWPRGVCLVAGRG
ncbi:MAG TPA: hypothetical protein VF940_04425, partial [Streptosporangiaceae bacterium]